MSVKRHWNRKMVIGAILVVAMVLPLFMMAFAARTSGSLGAITTSELTTRKRLIANIQAEEGPRWQPSITISDAGIATYYWLEQITGQNYTLKYLDSRQDVTAHGGWNSFSGEGISAVTNINLSVGWVGFISAAVSSDETKYLMFPNFTGADVTMCLWDSSAAGVNEMYSFSAGWTNPDFLMAGPINVAPAAGSIVVDSNDNLHMVWNNGTALFYNSSGGEVQVVDEAAIIGHIDMALRSSDNSLHVVYSKGSGGVDTKNIVYSSKAAGGSFSEAQVVGTADANEDAMPSIAVDPSGTPHVAWAKHVNSGNERYIIYHSKIGSAVQTPLSTDLGAYSKISSAQTNIVSFFPSINFVGEHMHVFYLDTTNVRDLDPSKSDFESGTDFDLVWQYYEDTTNLADNVLTLLQPTRTIGALQTFNDFYHTSALARTGDDLFLAWQAVNATSLDQNRLRFAKIDYLAPGVTFTSSLLDPSEIIQGEPIEVPQPSNFTLGFSFNEKDISEVEVRWDGQVLSSSTTGAVIVIEDAAHVALGTHTLELRAVDEFGNVRRIEVTIIFTGLDPLAVLFIVLTVLIIAAGVVIGLLLYVNRVNLARAKYTMSLGGKEEKKEEGWEDDGDAVIDDDLSKKLDEETRIDLKKVDLD